MDLPQKIKKKTSLWEEHNAWTGCSKKCQTLMTAFSPSLIKQQNKTCFAREALVFHILHKYEYNPCLCEPHLWSNPTQQ